MPAHPKTTILVVDDSQIVREVTATMLRDAGFDVVEAETGRGALGLARQQPDLIILDVHLPDLNGLDVCRQLKATPETASIPVLHLSGTFREVEDKIRGLETGADGYLTKPVGSAELIATVKALLRIRRAEAGLRESEIRRRGAEALVEVGRLLAQSLDSQEVGQRIADSVRRLLGAHAAGLFRVAPSGNLVGLAGSGDVDGAWGRSLVVPHGTGLAAVALEARCPVATSDLLSDPRVVHTVEGRARIEQSGYRAAVAVPLLVEDRVMGALVVRDRAGRDFGDEAIRIAQAFADQAALALENARLYTETRERLRETETLLAVGQVLSLDLATEEAMRRVARLVGRALQVEMVGAYMLDARKEFLRPLAGYHVPKHLVSAFLKTQCPLDRFAFVREAWATRQPVWSADAMSDPRFDHELLAAVRPRSVLFAPTPVRDEIVGGLFLVDWTPGRTFTPAELRLIEGVATQVGLALERADVARQTQTLQAMQFAVTRVLAESATLAEATPGLLQAIGETSGWDLGEAWRVDRDAQRLHWAGMWHIPSLEASSFAAGSRETVLAPGQGVVGEVWASGQPVWVPDAIAEDPVFLRGDPAATMGLRSAFAVPIRSGGDVTGVMAFFSRHPRSPDDNVLKMMADLDARIGQFAERKRAEEALRESQQTLRAVIDAMPVMINAKDAESRYLFMNRFQATLYGVSEQDAVSKTSAEMLGAEYGAYTAALDQQVIDTGQPLPHFEETYPDALGVVHTWLTTKVPLRDAGDRVTGVATIALDVTEHKRLEEQLRQSQKMEAIGQLAAGVAHDFNNLLTVIAGRATLVLQRLSPDDPSRRAIQLIEQTANRAAALTQQLLAFSRKQVHQPKVLDLNAIVTGVEPMLRRLLGETIDLVTAPGPALGRVRADPGQVEQVVLNLVVNARDAMPNGGQLTIETVNVEVDDAFTRHHPGARTGPFVMFAVSDTGVGMDAKTQARVFEPFFTTKEPGKGTGLGLATVYGIVKQHGGYVSVDSAPGRGATFRIYLPRVADTAEVVTAGDPPTTPARGRETVLLVEDEPRLREFVREVLETHGYQVLEASRPSEALRLAREHAGPIQVMVTDVVMPQMNGRELAERLTSVRPDLKVLYMSGYTDDAIVHHGGLDPGTAFLQKPFSPVALASKVRAVLDT